MPETKQKGSFGWLEKFGISFDQLDEDTQDLVMKLGENGVKKLVDENTGKVYHRGERLTPEEAVREAERIARTFSTSDEDPNFVGKGSKRAKSRPKMWNLDELKELIGDRLG